MPATVLDPTEEHAPLWPHGFHAIDVTALRARCVDAFTLSATRAAAMNALVVVIDRLVAANLSGELWLDGSFVTEKINPADIDFILVVDAVAYDSGTAEQRAIMDALISGADWVPVACDTNVAFIYPPERSNSADVLAYWQLRFGYSAKSHTSKGILVLRVGAGRAS